MSQGALPGFRDFYPADLAQRAHIMKVWRDVARRFAFAEYDGPPLEPLDLYTRKSGDEIVGQLYNFTDKGDREVALRPEMTPTLARMVAARANALRKPVRWFSMPQLFRYERQQRGRLREHYQLNVDIIGEPDVTADAELLAVAIGIMRGFGLGPTDVTARVSDRRLLSALLVHSGIPAERHPAVYAVVDKLERDPRDVLERRLADAGVDSTARERLFSILAIRDLRALRSALGEAPDLAEHFDRLERYWRHLEALGIADWARFDLSIVRGLAYYTGIVFELFDAKGEFRAICGGGRYDTLLKALGGVDLPALGFGMGDVVLGELLRDRGLMPTAPAALDFWVAGEDEALIGDVMRLASALRDRGHSVEYALRAQSLSRQMKTASSAGARQAVVLRHGDVTEGRATVRSMIDGTEALVQLDAWLASA
jgi:histidyl-tRNA synthetase